jgi:hypothetical protein
MGAVELRTILSDNEDENDSCELDLFHLQLLLSSNYGGAELGRMVAACQHAKEEDNL